MYPDDCAQALTDEWWTKETSKDVRRGRLVWSYIPISGQVPLKFTVTGRTEPTNHNSALVKIEPLRTNERQQKTKIPVAGLPQYDNEERAIYRVKRRPAIIITDGSEEVPRQVTRGKAKSNTAPMVSVVPCFGCEGGEKRGGYSPEFIDLVRRCNFPQFFWDIIPLPGARESILRFDQIQPIGRGQDALELTEYCLSPEALTIFDEWLRWYLFEELPQDSILADVKELMSQL